MFKVTLMIYVFGFPPAGPWGFSTNGDCGTAASAAIHFIDPGPRKHGDPNYRVAARCTDKAGNEVGGAFK